MFRRRQNCPACGRCLVATINPYPAGLHLHFRRHRRATNSAEVCRIEDEFRQYSVEES